MTEAYLGLAGLDLLYLATGYAVLYGIGYTLALRRAGLAFFTGWASIGLALAIAVCFGLDPGVPQTLVVAAGIAAGAAACSRLLARMHDPAAAAPAGLRRYLAYAGAAVLAVSLAAALVVGVFGPADTNWDVWAFWLPKAQAIYYFHGLDTGVGGFLQQANVTYPPLMPVVAATTFHFMGGVHPSLLPLQQTLLGISFVGAVAVLLRPRVPGHLLYPVLAMLVLAPEFWSRLPVVLPDQTVGYLLAAAAVVSVLWLLDGGTAQLVLAVIFLGAATMTKTEGFMLSTMLALIITAVAVIRRGRDGIAALVLLLGPAAILPWHRWLREQHRSTTATVYDWHKLFDPAYLGDRTHRLALALDKLTDSVFAFGIWSLVMPLALVACVLLLRSAPLIATAVVLWLLAGFAGLAATYWIGTPEIHWYLNTSAERVVATLPLVAGALLPLLLALVAETASRAEAAQLGAATSSPSAAAPAANRSS